MDDIELAVSYRFDLSAVALHDASGFDCDHLSMPITALHRLLGVAPGPVTDEIIDAAVSAGIAETDDLDWKSELPPAKGLSETDFPKDIAAMANSGGGVIVYGVVEAEKSAVSRKDVGDLSENHERALRAAALTAISPPVFGLGIARLGTPGKRSVAITIPPSVEGPHLIYRNHYFGAPIRNDADTAWMKEREIEASYRARFDDRKFTNDALRELYDDARLNWGVPDRAVMIAVARPRVPVRDGSRLTLDDATKIVGAARSRGVQLADQHGIHPLGNVAHNLRAGLRRWTAVNTATTEGTAWRAASAAVHDDGSVMLSATVGGYPQTSSKDFARGSLVESSAVECAVADFMALVRSSSSAFGTSEYEVRLGIEWAGEDPLLMQTTDQSGYPYTGMSVPLTRFTPVEATVVADASNADFHWRVFEVAEDCINEGGIRNVRMIEPPARD